MNDINFRKIFILILPRYYILVFLVCIIFAMYLYPGGVYHFKDGEMFCAGNSCINPGHKTQGYLFFKNFMSDLGRTISHNGDNNFRSSLLFNMALTFSGVTYIMFFISLPRLFNNKYLSWIGSVFGVIGGISFIGVAFTPADLYLKDHITHNENIFYFFLLSNICYSWLIYQSRLINNKYLIGNFIFVISLFMYILILWYAPKPYDDFLWYGLQKHEDGGLIVQAISQKLIMFSFFASIIVQTMAYKKILS